MYMYGDRRILQKSMYVGCLTTFCMPAIHSPDKGSAVIHADKNVMPDDLAFAPKLWRDTVDLATLSGLHDISLFL